MSDLPHRIEIHEEGPREGFQYESRIYPLAERAAFIEAGAVHVFDASTGTLVQTLQGTPPTDYDRFGYGLAPYATEVLVTKPDVGAAYRIDPVTGTVVTTYVAPSGTVNATWHCVPRCARRSARSRPPLPAGTRRRPKRPIARQCRSSTRWSRRG